jgi:hypothetical protein
MKKVKKEKQLIAFRAFPREILLIEKARKPSESVSAFVRAAIRYFAEERLYRE